MTTFKAWRKSDARAVRRAVDAGQPCQRCDCCGGDLPPQEVWEELRQTGRGPDCTGAVDHCGNCHAFAEVMP